MVLALELLLRLFLSVVVQEEAVLKAPVVLFILLAECQAVAESAPLTPLIRVMAEEVAAAASAQEEVAVLIMVAQHSQAMEAEQAK